ncbi:MAG TPA: PDZ domain-containing protein [Vicinamibacterales bacterium]|jgi:predicted metalloprotease with PDZ domain
MDPIRYTLSFPEPHTHYVDVTASVPCAGQSSVELMMAVWTPGSYLVREYQRHVESVTAENPDGRDLPVDKTAKNRWKIATGGAPIVTVTYRVYGREMSVRTNWIESRFALINGAPTFLTLADRTPRPHLVTIVPAEGWTRSMTGLAEGGGPHHYCAADYDTLVDSPILVGNPAVYDFTVGGVQHWLVNEGESGVFDGVRAVRDVEAIVCEHLRMWGSLPYDKYMFLNVITEGGGGLEHRNSAVLMASRWATRTRKSYVSWLELVSHEFFHVWNVKRLRPVELGPFEYERETHTRSLWAVEGVTEYYGILLLHRAGLMTRDETLEALSEKIEALQTTPGRLVQSMAQASFDAWIKLYRPDENSPNTSISYYTKGAVIAFLLDAMIRHATGAAKSLDDVMREAYRQYSGQRGFTAQQLRGLVEDLTGRSLSAFWSNAIEGTGELKYAEALDFFGLRFKPETASAGERQKVWIGATTKIDEGRLVVTHVKRGTPAFNAGINVDDEIIAIDDLRVRADRFDQRLEQYSPGTKVSVLVARREQLLELDLRFGVEPARLWRLEMDPIATPAQASQLTGWLKGFAEPAG